MLKKLMLSELVLGVAAAVVTSIPDLQRYFKMRSM
jgi:hypothetical protein